MMSHSSTKIERESELEKVITHRSQGRSTAASRGHTVMLRQDAGGVQVAGPGAHAFIKVHGWNALGFLD